MNGPESWFAEGKTAGDIAADSLVPTQCPYVSMSVAARWWNRGYSYTFRLLRSIAAEQSVAAMTAERDALRSQVADLTALGVSLHKAAAAGRDAERAAVVAWLRSDAPVPMWRAALGQTWGHVSADAIEAGAHRGDE